MGQSALISVVQFMTTLMMLAFYVGAFAFVIWRRTDRSSAKSLAATALAIMFFTHVGNFVFTYWISRTSTQSDVVTWLSLFSMASTFCYMVALGMLVAAVFSQRPATDIADLSGAERMPARSDNPYSTPTR